MPLFPKKHKSSPPVLSLQARLGLKRDTWQESADQLTPLQASHADLLQQKATLESEYHNVLIAAGQSVGRHQSLDTGETVSDASENRSAIEAQLAHLQRAIAAVEAALIHRQAIHTELTRELAALQNEVSQQNHREYMEGLEARVQEKKEQLIAHLYGGCGLLAELVKLAEEAYTADERASLTGNTLSNAGHRFVQDALEDLNLRTTPIIMMERAGFAPVMSNLALANRAYEVRALAPPRKAV